MAEKQFTHELIHAGFYRRVNGVLQPLAVGTKLILTDENGEDMVKRGLVKAIHSQGAIEATEDRIETSTDEAEGMDKEPKKQQRKRHSKK